MPVRPVTLLVGSEELLLRRAADRVLDEIRAERGEELDVLDLRAPDLSEDGLPDMRTSSLFGTPRALVLREAQELPAGVSATLVELVEAGVGDSHVVLLASGTGRIRSLAKKLTDAGARVDVTPPREWEDAKWAALVAEEFRRHGRSAEPAAVQAVLAHAGLDVAGIAEKVAQASVAATAGGRVTAKAVEAVVTGHGSRGSFAVADAMCERRPAEALTLLRGVLDAGDDPVMVLGALTYRLRSIVAVAGRLDPGSVGLRISAGQARRLEGVRRSFGSGQLTAAYRALAAADAEIKGGELDPVLILERAVVEVAGRD